MATAPGPWDRPPPRPEPRKPAIGLFVWIVVLVATGLGLWQLSELVPGRPRTVEDDALIVRNLIILAVATSGLIFMRRVAVRRAVRDIAIWVAAGVVVLAGYAYQDELRQVNARVLAALLPGYAASSGEKESILTISADGHFHIVCVVNGTPVDFLIDTGASEIVLSPDDARRVGIAVGALTFSRRYDTANGVGRGAPVTLRSLAVGPIRRAELAASVNQADMTGSLLGMTFFRDVASFEVRGRTLFIRWR